ncbi:E22 family MetX-like putative esterase [Shewanella zhangzhouensis]|uniref:E22 family MetX-like putative esterase n=1 Tax=Shewanella zhangzhouensis TaxID=2864213 RepID=UPI001C658A5B|nr:homoserine O-acetyltransferase [Shewanella zhangzhouensis]QYK07009.1 homoserine O-acetyltransferase [Shewanella zhangzhouensis]
MFKNLIFFIVMLLTFDAWCYEDIVKKQSFFIPSFKTFNGNEIKNVRVGWESYGTLNSDKSNVILICHYFGGNSHAAGRYSINDAKVGYWDSIIGPGKPIDTDKYFVISVDSLVNLEVGNPNVITTGPASIDPATGKPYGMDFPVVTIRDFVEVQKQVLDSIGIDKLHAVIGPSMGALQAYEWGSVYPDKVSRIIPVIGSGWASANLIGWLNIWSAPIKLDKNWNKGNYYKGLAPVDGLTESLKVIALHGQHWEWANKNYGRNWADATHNPMDAYANQFQIEQTLYDIAKSRAILSDANHFLYLAKACQLFFTGHSSSSSEGLSRISAPVMIIYTEKDQIFISDQVKKTSEMIAKDGTPVYIVELHGSHGHFDGVISIDQAGEAISQFLNM